MSQLWEHSERDNPYFKVRIAMRCLHCGWECPEGARFCGGCGRPLTASIHPVPPGAERAVLKQYIANGDIGEVVALLETGEKRYKQAFVEAIKEVASTTTNILGFLSQLIETGGAHSLISCLDGVRALIELDALPYLPLVVLCEEKIARMAENMEQAVAAEYFVSLLMVYRDYGMYFFRREEWTSAIPFLKAWLEKIMVVNDLSMESASRVAVAQQLSAAISLLGIACSSAAEAGESSEDWTGIEELMRKALSAVFAHGDDGALRLQAIYGLALVYSGLRKHQECYRLLRDNLPSVRTVLASLDKSAKEIYLECLRLFMLTIYDPKSLRWIMPEKEGELLETICERLQILDQMRDLKANPEKAHPEVALLIHALNVESPGELLIALNEKVRQGKITSEVMSRLFAQVFIVVRDS